MQRTLPLIIAVLFIASCSNEPTAHSPQNNEATDTLKKHFGETMYTGKLDDYYKDQVNTEKLKGNYEVYYTTDDSMKYVYLKHDSIVHRLNAVPLNAGSFYNLGVVMGDANDFFFLGHDNGNGAPYYIEVIDKKTGKNKLAHEVVYIEGNYNNDYLVYYDDTDKGLKEKFAVYDIVH